MKRIHGDSVHRGKKYKSGSGDMPVSGERNDNTLAIMKDENDDPVETLKELNRKLREAVEIENFEEAAKLRDKIRMLKSSSRINRNEEQGGGQDA